MRGVDNSCPVIFLRATVEIHEGVAEPRWKAVLNAKLLTRERCLNGLGGHGVPAQNPRKRAKLMQQTNQGSLLGGEAKGFGDDLSVTADGDGVAGEGNDGSVVKICGAGADKTLKKTIERERSYAVLDAAGSLGNTPGFLGKGGEEMEQCARVGTQQMAYPAQVG